MATGGGDGGSGDALPGDGGGGDAAVATLHDGAPCASPHCACTGTRRADLVVLRELRDEGNRGDSSNGGNGGDGDGQAARQLAITRVERDDALLDVMERQLLAFHAEAHVDDEPFPLEPVHVAQLRLALRDARAERVGEERVHDL